MLMKITIKREALLKPLQMVIGVVERKQTLPVLANVLLSITGSTLSVTGTDSEVQLKGHALLDQPQANTMTLTVPGRKLFDICRALPDKSDISLSTEKDQVVLKAGRTRFALSTLPTEDFPTLELTENNASFVITQHDLKHLLQRSCFSMAHQDVRYYLNGLLVELLPSELRVIATDGHRLALNSTTIQTQVSAHNITH